MLGESLVPRLWNDLYIYYYSTAKRGAMSLPAVLSKRSMGETCYLNIVMNICTLQ